MLCFKVCNAIGKDLVASDIRESMGNYPELGRKTKAIIPNCELVEIENIGHLPHIEAFDKFIKPVIKFIEN